VEAAIVSLRSSRNGYVVYRTQEVEVEAAAKVPSQIMFSFSAMVSYLLDEVSGICIPLGWNDTEAMAEAVETEHLVLQ